MAFLVFVQGAELVGDVGIGFAALFGVALLVGAITAGLAYAVEGRLGRRDTDETTGGTENGKERV